MPQNKQATYDINLAAIALAAESNIENHAAFVDFLKQADTKEIDEKVMGLNALIEPQIDCTSCGNCCKSLMINVEDAAIERLSVALHLSTENFTTQYIEQGSSGMNLMKAIPCPLLKDNKCTAYAARPEGCSSFPHLHEPGFTKRLYFVMNHYGMCPIVYHVVEGLKKALGWKGAVG